MKAHSHLVNFFSVGIFLILMCSSLLAGHHGYCEARSLIREDLNHALSLMIKEGHNDIVTTDTIKTYRRLQNTSNGMVLMAVADERFCKNLKYERLKNSAFISIDVIDDRYVPYKSYDDMVCGDSLILGKKCHGETIALRGYARLSAASVFQLSDQRASATLFLMSLAWAAVSLCYVRRRHDDEKDACCYGGLVYTDDTFYNSEKVPVHFTPMQHQLMQMFINTPSHALTKEEICAALWPRKEDANDTLYTLIRRIKPILENNSSLTIVSDRSRGYSLEIK